MELWSPPRTPHLLEWWRPLVQAGPPLGRALALAHPLDEFRLAGRVSLGKPARRVDLRAQSPTAARCASTPAASPTASSPRRAGRRRAFHPCPLRTAVWKTGCRRGRPRGLGHTPRRQLTRRRRRDGEPAAAGPTGPGPERWWGVRLPGPLAVFATPVTARCDGVAPSPAGGAGCRPPTTGGTGGISSTAEVPGGDVPHPPGLEVLERLGQLGLGVHDEGPVRRRPARGSAGRPAAARPAPGVRLSWVASAASG